MAEPLIEISNQMRKYDVNTGIKLNNPVKGCQALFVKGRRLAGFCPLKVNEPHFVSETKCGSLTVQEKQIPEGRQDCSLILSVSKTEKKKKQQLNNEQQKLNKQTKTNNSIMQCTEFSYYF